MRESVERTPCGRWPPTEFSPTTPPRRGNHRAAASPRARLNRRGGQNDAATPSFPNSRRRTRMCLVVASKPRLPPARANAPEAPGANRPPRAASSSARMYGASPLHAPRQITAAGTPESSWYTETSSAAPYRRSRGTVLIKSWGSPPLAALVVEFAGEGGTARGVGSSSRTRRVRDATSRTRCPEKMRRTRNPEPFRGPRLSRSASPSREPVASLVTP